MSFSKIGPLSPTPLTESHPTSLKRDANAKLIQEMLEETENDLKNGQLSNQGLKIELDEEKISEIKSAILRHQPDPTEVSNFERSIQAILNQETPSENKIKSHLFVFKLLLDSVFGLLKAPNSTKRNDYFVGEVENLIEAGNQLAELLRKRDQEKETRKIIENEPDSGIVEIRNYLIKKMEENRNLHGLLLENYLDQEHSIDKKKREETREAIEGLNREMQKISEEQKILGGSPDRLQSNHPKPIPTKGGFLLKNLTL